MKQLLAIKTLHPWLPEYLSSMQKKNSYSLWRWMVIPPVCRGRFINRRERQTTACKRRKSVIRIAQIFIVNFKGSGQWVYFLCSPDHGHGHECNQAGFSSSISIGCGSMDCGIGMVQHPAAKATSAAADLWWLSKRAGFHTGCNLSWHFPYLCMRK